MARNMLTGNVNGAGLKYLSFCVNFDWISCSQDEFRLQSLWDLLQKILQLKINEMT